jgi:hypothetical protein
MVLFDLLIFNQIKCQSAPHPRIGEIGIFNHQNRIGMKKKFWTSDKVVSIVAIGISLFTLFIFVKQTNIIEQQSKLSVLPYLMFDSANNGENLTFSVDLVNYGVGPAVIESKRIHYKGKTFDLDLYEFLRDQIPEMDSIHLINYTTLDVGVAVPANSERNLIILGGDSASYRRFLRILDTVMMDGFDYEIKYKSIYNEHWMISTKNNMPKQIED